jgi:hypothetical protein
VEILHIVSPHRNIHDAGNTRTGRVWPALGKVRNDSPSKKSSPLAMDDWSVKEDAAVIEQIF